MSPDATPSFSSSRPCVDVGTCRRVSLLRHALRNGGARGLSQPHRRVSMSKFILTTNVRIPINFNLEFTAWLRATFMNPSS